jgi:hypothetical protein
MRGLRAIPVFRLLLRLLVPNGALVFLAFRHADLPRPWVNADYGLIVALELSGFSGVSWFIGFSNGGNSDSREREKI